MPSEALPDRTTGFLPARQTPFRSSGLARGTVPQSAWGRRLERRQSKFRLYRSRARLLVSRRAAKVTQAEIARALRAAATVGGAYQVEITQDGLIRIVPVDPHHVSEPTADPDKWQERLLDANPNWK
jgi:hypothetical protein